MPFDEVSLPKLQVRHPRADGSSGRRLDPVLDFMRLLWEIEHGLQTTSKRMRATRGITGPQRLVLKVVSQHPGLSAKDVASFVHLHPSTLTGIIQRLVAKRLLTKDRDPADTRRMCLRATARAASFVRQSPGTVEAAVDSVLSSVPSAHVQTTRSVLTAVAGALSTNHSR